MDGTSEKQDPDDTGFLSAEMTSPFNTTSYWGPSGCTNIVKKLTEENKNTQRNCPIFSSFDDYFLHASFVRHTEDPVTVPPPSRPGSRERQGKKRSWHHGRTGGVHSATGTGLWRNWGDLRKVCLNELARASQGQGFQTHNLQEYSQIPGFFHREWAADQARWGTVQPRLRAELQKSSIAAHFELGLYKPVQMPIALALWPLYKLILLF